MTMSDVGVWEEYRVQEAYSNGRKNGELAERAAIIEWLCNYAVLLQNPDYRGIARKIERDEHLRGDDE